MSEEFDKRLKDHITDVFDNYEGGSADAGWALLREKYPQKDSRRPIAWWWFGVAAGLLLVASTTLWLYRGNEKGNAKLQRTTLASTTTHHDTATAQTSASHADTLPAKVGANNGTTRSADPAAANTNARYLAGQAKYGRHKDQRTVVASKPASQKGTDKINSIQANPTQSTNTPQLTDTAKTQGLIALSKPVALSNTDTMAGHKADTATTAKKPLVLAADKPRSNTPIGKKTIWSAFVAGYDVLSNPGDASYNMGAGFSTDFKLTRVVWLSTGLGLYKNTFAYSPTGGGGLYYSPPTTATGSPIITNYNADQVVLELPLRLSFQISKGGNYLSTGLSSAFFIKETYRQSYSYSNTGNFSTATPGGSQSAGGTTLPADVTSTTTFSTFAFAKTFDVAAGFGYTLGKNRLVLEPFLKVPVNSLNHGYLRYGAIGAALKFSFGASVK
jgi:hypothetical protein